MQCNFWRPACPGGPLFLEGGAAPLGSLGAWLSPLVLSEQKITGHCLPQAFGL